MDTFASVQIGKSTGDIGSKGETKAPGKWLGLVVDVETKVSVLNVFGDDEYSVVRRRCSRKTQEEHNIGMSRLLHQPPFSLKVFANVVLGGWENFLDGDVDAQVFPCNHRYRGR